MVYHFLCLLMCSLADLMELHNELGHESSHGLIQLQLSLLLKPWFLQPVPFYSVAHYNGYFSFSNCQRLKTMLAEKRLTCLTVDTHISWKVDLTLSLCLFTSVLIVHLFTLTFCYISEDNIIHFNLVVYIVYIAYFSIVCPVCTHAA